MLLIWGKYSILAIWLEIFKHNHTKLVHSFVKIFLYYPLPKHVSRFPVALSCASANSDISFKEILILSCLSEVDTLRMWTERAHTRSTFQYLRHLICQGNPTHSTPKDVRKKLYKGKLKKWQHRRTGFQKLLKPKLVPNQGGWVSVSVSGLMLYFMLLTF